MNVRGMIRLIAVTAPLLSSASFGQMCGQVCGPATACDQPCYVCRFHVQDYCPEQYTTWTTCGQYRGGEETYDMVEWMVQTYNGHWSTYLSSSNNDGPISDFSFHDTVNRRFYRINEPGGNYNELFEYDDQNIYIRREARNVSGGVYLLSPNFIWTKRYVTTGKACGTAVISDSEYTRFEGCRNAGSTGPLFQMGVSGPETLYLGGNVGTVSALRLTQVNPSNPNDAERYYYARPWGMVYYEKVENNIVTYSETLNTTWPNPPSLQLPCGLPY